MAASRQVVFVTATYRRPEELRRLLVSLAGSRCPLGGGVVVDNAGDGATKEIVEGCEALRIGYVAPGQNLGCGGGLDAGVTEAFQAFPSLTHVWILDDDCVVEPETLGTLLSAMQAGGAAVSHPLTEDEHGRLSWFPGLTDAQKFRWVREPHTPESFVRLAGPEPIPFSWSQGIALLVTREAVEALGRHRTDYWVRGEDLEFSLRLTHRWPGLYVPTARVRHLPPASSHDAAAEYPKHLAMLQNIAYTALRLPHGRRIARTIPGNWRRFHATWGWALGRWWDSLRAFWWGAVRGVPAGVKGPATPPAP